MDRNRTIQFILENEPRGEVAPGKLVFCTDRIVGGPVPFGTIGKVKSVSRPFATVNWLGKSPAGSPWHWSDKDTMLDLISVWRPSELFRLKELSAVLKTVKSGVRGKKT